MTHAEQLEAQASTPAIRSELNRILSSAVFKNSRRHKRFLTYIVEKTLAGEAEEIKERSVGIDVFDRAADYDPANDAIVRVAAGEIRKRLAQYYLHEGADDEVIIELPLGSYVPVFLHKSHSPQQFSKEQREALPPAQAASAPGPLHASSPEWQPAAVPGELEAPHTAQAAPEPPEARKMDDSEAHERSVQSVRSVWPRNSAFRLALSGLAAAAILAGALFWLFRPRPALEVFWKPFLPANQEPLVCIGDLNFIMPPDERPLGAESVNDVMRNRNHIGQNDLNALVRLTGITGKSGQALRILLADQASLADIRTGPAILIGAFDNVWTQKIAEELPVRLVLSPERGVQGIVSDSSTGKPQQWELDPSQRLGSIHRDYALVARVRSSLTGQYDLLLAGVGPYGTVAASEFVTNPEYFGQFAAQAPKGWENHNVEIVLSADVVNGHSSPPQLVMFRVF